VEYVQKYCDAEDAGPPGAPGGATASIYTYAILYTMIAGWSVRGALLFPCSLMM
jgi:hypothetical protein